MKAPILRLGTPTALAVMLCASASCVPVEIREARRAEKVIAEAEPLLTRLGVAVPDPATLSPGAVVAAPARAPGDAPPPFVAGSGSADDQARALDCLTSALYYEARSEGSDGQRAVAQVVLNRVRDRAFPASVCGVVFQGSNRSTGCQFSFTCDGSMRARREPGAWERARAIADAALGGSVYAPVGSATHFHTTAISPWWAPSLARIGAVGAHVFYRWRGALERMLTFRQAYAGVEPGAGRIAPAVAVARVDLGDGAAVTVHRGVDASVAAPARTLLAAGVRVHLNRAPSAEAAQDWSGAYEIDGTGIGAESDPI